MRLLLCAKADRRSRTRRKAEAEQEQKDYKALLTAMFADMPRYFNTPHKMKIARHYRAFFIKISLFATEQDYRNMYEALIRGDPKMRSFRALYQTVYTRYINAAKAERRKAVEQA